MNTYETALFPEEVKETRARWSVSWAMWGLLLTLGGAVLAVAFRLLDPHDNRTLYNPWTYVVLVPIALVLISTILSTLVSRFVERSLQAAFLLSVLVHLCILSYAGSVVIFSRAWPDLFDTLAEDRIRLKQQTLQAKQYVKHTRSTSSGQVPDYLRYVPTEHSPNQLSESSRSAEPVKSTDVSLLQSPEPKLMPSESVAMMKRSVPASSTAVLSDFAAELSRSPLTQPSWQNKFLGRIQPVDSSSSFISETPSEEITELPRQTDLNRAAASQIELKQEYRSNLAMVEVAELPISPTASSLQRRSVRPEVPLHDQKSVALQIQRSTTAGGMTGPAARSSQPISGQPEVASPEPDIESHAAMPTPRRKSHQGAPSATIPLPSIGTAKSPNWDQTPSFSNAFAGRSPLELARQKLDGEAAVADIAALDGAARDIERSAGTYGPPEIRAQATLTPNSLSTPIEGRQLNEPLDAQAPTGPADTALGTRRTRSTQSNKPAELSAAGGLKNVKPSENTAGVQLPLEIEANTGLGGLSAIAASNPNSLLPERRRLGVELGLPTHDNLRLERSNLGGSSGPATNSSVAKPAFQQRLDRLNNISESPKIGSMEPQTELSIERGLEFLARYQRADGSWRLQDFDTEVLIRSDTAATGLALLSFQGAGYTHLSSKYAKQVDRAIRFLIRHQKPDGDLYIPQDPASDQNAWLYSHSIAALALCEAYGMTQDERLRPSAQRAVDFMVQSQDQRRGGWRYRPATGSDTSVSGWFMMALKSGELAGLDIPPKTFEALRSFLSNAQVGSSKPHLYRYNPYAPDTIEQGHGLRPTAVMTSVGLLMRLYLGWDRGKPEMLDGTRFLLEHSPKHGSKSQSLRDTYYWYYATQVVFHVGGDHWKRWNESLYPLLIDHQVADGPYKGSWAPFDPVPDLWARYGGRLYVTTLNLLSLEVSYRHLPLYEATAPLEFKK